MAQVASCLPDLYSLTNASFAFAPHPVSYIVSGTYKAVCKLPKVIYYWKKNRISILQGWEIKIDINNVNTLTFHSLYKSLLPKSLFKNYHKQRNPPKLSAAVTLKFASQIFPLWQEMCRKGNLEVRENIYLGEKS